ncbi:MAG: branched-chain amino acid ABC transporter permease [Chloroflexales bacterium]|nr:branched-chain amino acid ABC transporter permease [Chloroflexales bacterium]
MMLSDSMNTDAIQSKRERTRMGYRLAVLALVVALLAMALPSITSAFWLRTFTSTAIFALASSGAALLYGRLGLVSLAQVALLGAGAWVALRLSFAAPLPFELIILATGLSTALAGLVIGLPALRVRGLYLALVTLMFAGGFQVIITTTGFPDGGGGLLGRVSGGARLSMARPWIAQSDEAYFRYVLVMVVLGFLLVELHKRSRAGRAWAVIRRSEAGALSAGVHVTVYKTWAFMLSGFLSGIAGALLAGSVGQLDGRNFPASDSILLFALTVVGGAYSWVGQVIAALLFRAVPALLDSFGVNGNIALIIFGAALLQALITAPAGTAGQLADLVAAIRRRLGSAQEQQQ